MQTKQDPREPVLLMALTIMLHAKLCLSVIISFFACVGIQKEYAMHCLVEGRGGKLGLLGAYTIPHAFGCTGFLLGTS